MLSQRVKDIFSIDSRALGIFRICLALILIFDLIVRSFSLTAHYTDFGVLPLGVYMERFVNSQWISLHNLNGSFVFQLTLFFIAFLFAFSMLIGYKTKLSSIVSWFLLISLHSRNPVILQGGDVMLRLLFFWAMFLPLGIRYSVDSNIKNSKNSVLSFGTAGILLQVAFVYLFSALLKTGNEWFPDGTAIYYALQLDQFATYFGKFLLNFPNLLFYMTHFVYFLELIGPFLLFMPFFFNKIRITTTFAFIITLRGMALSLRLGHFPFVGIAGFVLFLPSVFWDKLSVKIRLFKKNNRFVFRDGKKKILKIILNVVALFFIIYIFLWNVQETFDVNAVPDNVEFVAYKFRVDQYWNMFAPYPLKDDGWYVIEGVLANEQVIDLFRNGDLVDYEKPKHVASLYKHERWRKYMMNLWDRDYSAHRVFYLDYLCYDWNKDHSGDERLESITMNFMLEVTGEDYYIYPVDKVVLEAIDCQVQ